ncbi:S-layer homology domain-containing protein [Cylindrospermum sp. FACHB-282]|uniref:S-layer homology domain-containing protein n=1 Tax=Cylindrospermum sp. FACHB-282 TaxID=2692794 RepID=UPI001682CB99|nr:S-layer homology domain-containing protein [Cylindrospermum sp. FACHB-282]MBD2388459.1 S-layer homology domain-containing protein [Cylindrospermum sp. FACHB-282]
MLPYKRPAVFLSLAVLLSSLTACGNGPVAKNLEQSLAADPRLQNNPVVFGEVQGEKPLGQPTESTVQLPADFPKDIPLYPNAKLEEIKKATDSENRVSTRWQSSDPSNLIASFYRNQFQAKNWQILRQPTDDGGGSFEVRRQDLLLKVSIQAKSVTTATANQPQTSTELLLEYVPSSTATAQPNPTQNSQLPQPGDAQFIGPVPPGSNLATQPTTTPDNQTTLTVTSESPEFNDLNKVPPEWRQHIQDLAALGIFSQDAKATKNNFEPSKIITHREYAHWLVAANNAMNANNPAKQIRLAPESAQPAFSDVSAKDPDFAAIQGLAEAGLIPSLLSGDSTAVLFRPDAPLTREQLLLWKLPLDTRQALPAANLDAVKQTWGFQDVGKIDPKALRAVLADFQNGEQSNIRRVFGYTTLFQPKKPVTRAEAAAALWYFGTQGEGISAAEALKLKR